MNKKNIAIFASGNGSNAEEFFKYFRNHPSVNVSCLLSNNSNAYALIRARNNKVSTMSFNREDFNQGKSILEYLKKKEVSHIVLAGFMWLIPQYLIQAFPNQIVNIHPALLPKYGGKGMYGHHVHEAVLKNKETESGITIHFVNEVYDDGKILFQASCPILPNDDPDSLANRIHKLEYDHYPKVVEAVVMDAAMPPQ